MIGEGELDRIQDALEDEYGFRWEMCLGGRGLPMPVMAGGSKLGFECRSQKYKTRASAKDDASAVHSMTVAPCPTFDVQLHKAE